MLTQIKFLKTPADLASKAFFLLLAIASACNKQPDGLKTITMKLNLKNFHLFILLAIASLLTLSFSHPVQNLLAATSRVAPAEKIPVVAIAPASPRSAYDSLHLDLSGLTRQAYDFALKGVEKLKKLGKLTNTSIVTIVDFSQPSYQKRLYVVDLSNYRVLFNTWVAHGRNSGREWAQSFSNTMSSYKSSPGFYVTGETYIGGNGYSLKLNGMEKGINDRANERAIVLHGADYVSQDFIRHMGYIGRSFGCPAVSLREAYPIINTIKNGTCLFIYHPGKSYTQHSPILG